MRCIASVNADVLTAKKLFTEMRQLTEADGKIVQHSIKKIKQNDYFLVGFGTSVPAIQYENHIVYYIQHFHIYFHTDQ